MNRRKLFKTGLALAGGSVLASVAGAQNTAQGNKGSSPSQTCSKYPGSNLVRAAKTWHVGSLQYWYGRAEHAIASTRPRCPTVRK